MAHDSRGAPLKKGDRVFVEMEIVEEVTSDQGYCNAFCRAIVPDQRDRPPMAPPACMFNTRMLTKIGACLLLALLATGHRQQATGDDKDVPWKAKAEIARRGAHVEHVSGIAAEPTALIGELLAPPEDDSHKWHFTLVTTRGCKFCDQLRGDFLHAPVLQAWVNVEDYKKSWAHWQVVQIEDQSQAWRWKDFKPTQFPTLIVQPPVDRSWGDPHTIVFVQTGYDGKPDKLAAKLRAALDAYAKKIQPVHAAWKAAREAKLASQGSGFKGQGSGFRVQNSGGIQDAGGVAQPAAGGWNPPVTPPSPLGPPAPPQSYPPPPADPTTGGLALLLQLLASSLPSLGTILLLLTAVSNVWMLYRELAQKAGIKTILSDEQAAQLVELLKKLSGGDSKT